MDSEKFENTWQKYLINFFQGVAAPLLVDDESGLPYLFSNPLCATCKYWHPVHRDGLDQISAPQELNYIEKGLQGKKFESVSLGEGESDVYSYHEFYGWCKRYPPIHRDSYSVISFRPLFSFVSRKIPQKIADYQFPILSHMNTCGEWSKGDWVSEFVEENKK